MNPLRIIAIRHFQTEKNILGVHGYSERDEITQLGYGQANELVAKLSEYSGLRSITCFPKQQVIKSALVLSELSGLPYEEPLCLQPMNIGIASGITHEQLIDIDVSSATSMEAFRTRDIDILQVRISGAESAASIEKRLLEWWDVEGRFRCINRAVIGSNSTLIMLANLLSNKLPSSGDYKCFGIPTGAYRVWEQSYNGQWRTTPPIEFCRWPEIECRRIHSSRGSIQTTYYYPGWQYRKHTCIIAPGFFGNSRMGPYGLYNRLASELAFLGIDCVTFDYLGSGESSPVTRSFETDVASIRMVLSNIDNSNIISIIGHSIGSAAVAKICGETEEIQGFALAPLCRLSDFSGGFFTKEQIAALLREKVISRRGINLFLQYIIEAEQAWNEGQKKLKAIITAGTDPYTAVIRDSDYEAPVFRIAAADHNFSPGNSSQELINAIIRLLVG